LHIFKRAKKERVVGPFLERLLSLDAQSSFISPDIRDILKKTYYDYLFQCVFFSKKAWEMLDEIESLGLEVLLFKGPAVDYPLYGSEAMRPRSDIDVLVKKQDLGLFENRLSALGYTTAYREGSPIFEFAKSKIFAKNIPGAIAFHIHTTITNNLILAAGGLLPLNEKKIWEEIVPFKEYTNVMGLQPEAQMFFLIEHSLKHDFSPLVWLYEIDCLLQCYGQHFDWQKLVSLGHAVCFERPLYFGLFSLSKIFSTPMPQEVISCLKPKRFSWGEKIFIGRLLENKPRKYFSYAVYLSMADGLAGKIRCVRQTVFPLRSSARDSFVRISRGVHFIFSTLCNLLTHTVTAILKSQCKFLF
jgi:hypothetical protein